MHLPSAFDRLSGPPLSLPRGLDVLSEHYWRLGPRRRAALVGIAVVSLVVLVPTQLARSPWGEPVDVAVAARDLPAGHTLGEGDLRTVRWPDGLVPDAAVTADARGTLTGLLPRGAVLTESHLGDGGHGALVTDGRVAVALPLDLVPEHAVGAVLDVVGTDGQGGARTLATAARVVAVDDAHLWVELDRAHAADVAAAVRNHAATAVVHPP